MNLRGGRRENPEVNLTPLIDVVFLLLIFFMVSTTFKHTSEIEVELPRATPEPVDTRTDAVELVIDAQGRYFIGDQAVVNPRLNTLQRALAQVMGEDRRRPLLIRADGRAPHQAVVTAMDAAARLGIEQLSIATVHARPR
ncbi:MAG TPA: biopolymer transporter ExbD [Oceanithermus profundus]|uniref:Biopolymer transporter ExbD n=1 Tax=Oceanithermus profundus TaxID=187137 RepID=A0A7C5SPQ1_9DEIN|nr:biopolymer transporter ExbD [Oceanithermus profundus]